MNKANNFYLNKLENVVIIGFSQVLDELIKINETLKIKTSIISSSDQSKNFKHKHKIFNEVNDELYEYISENFEIDKTLFISLGSRIIFKKSFIDFLHGNLINFHGTRLPYDAGGGGFSWKIMREDRISNQLVHLVNEGIDTGPIIDSKSSIFPANCKIPEDYENYRLKEFLKFYETFITKIKNGHKFELKHQPNYIGRYNPRLSTEDNGYIDWSYAPNDLINFINAFDNPYLGAMSFLNRGDFGRLHLKSVHLHGGDSSNHPYMSGIVSRHDKDWIVVSTRSKYSLLVEKVLNSDGKNIIDKILPGDRFYTPSQYLENSVSKKVIFSSEGKITD